MRRRRRRDRNGCGQPRGRYLYTRRCRKVRVLARRGDRALSYRGRPVALLVLTVLVIATLAAGVVTGLLVAAAASAGLLLLVWLAYALRLTRIVPAGPGDGPTPPGGASMREPRRPLPHSPAGAAALPIPDEEPPGAAIALA